MDDVLIRKAKDLGFAGVMQTIDVDGLSVYEMLMQDPDKMDADETMHTGRPQLLIVKGKSVSVASDAFVEKYLDKLATYSDDELDDMLKDCRFMS